MNKIIKKIFLKIKSLNFLLSPVLAVTFPILSFYLSNISELSLKFIEKPLFYSIVASIIGALFLFILTKKRNQSAIIISVIALIFFSYGHLSKFLTNILFIQLPNRVILGPDKILLPFIFILFVFFSIKIIKSTKTFTQTVAFFNVSLLILVGYLDIVILKNEYLKKNNSVTLTNQFQNKTFNSKETAPDIYYIVLDGYAREDILQNIYQYDNSKFIDNLKKMGFYIADKARSNYIHTFLSLPSSLNMRYLDDLPQKYGKNSVDESPARQLLSENEVSRKLKNYGYTTINFSSTWGGTDESYKADIIYKGDKYFKIFGKNISIDEANITFLQTTILSPLIKEVLGDALRERIMDTLQKLPTIPFKKGKKFVTAHFLIPHPPYVFTADGNPVPGAEFEFADEGIDKRPKYLDQLTFISRQIIPVLQKIIQNSSTPPIIILQSDHGPGSIFGKRSNWLKNYSEEGIKERSSILYTIYLPNNNYQQFYQTITPVNTFRILFNNYFDENLELLPDKTFYTNLENIYDFKDITKEINRFLDY